MPPVEILKDPGAGGAVVFENRWKRFESYLILLATVQLRRESAKVPLLAKVDPEDLVQEVMLRAWQYQNRFQGTTEAEWLAWLRVILANVLTDQVRAYLSDKRDVCLEIRINLDRTSGNLEGLLAARNGATPLTRMAREQELERVCAAILQLNGDAKTVIMARHLEGMTLHEIALRMGKNREAVAKIWARGLVRLRQILMGGG